jgi:hypothetical protein
LILIGANVRNGLLDAWARAQSLQEERKYYPSFSASVLLTTSFCQYGEGGSVGKPNRQGVDLVARAAMGQEEMIAANQL